jgi:uncharacterized protein (TIGR02444 family)
MSASFWDFSLKVYGGEGVETECLALQDQFGVDVNLLLLCAFAGAQGATLTEHEVASARKTVEPWQRNIVSSLRTARRAMKPVARHDAQELRTRLKEIELESERIEQTMLQEWIDARRVKWQSGDRRAAVLANLQTLLGSYGVDRAWAEAGLKNMIAAALSAAPPR